MEHEQIKQKLITNGVKNLIAFGYENANEDNILTDEVYSLFFVKMLKDNLGSDNKIDDAINELISNHSHKKHC